MRYKNFFILMIIVYIAFPSLSWFNDTYSFRKQINIINNINETLYGYQLLLNVTYIRDMQSDFGDLIFTFPANRTEFSKNYLEFDNANGGKWYTYISFQLKSPANQSGLYKVIINGSKVILYNCSEGEEISGNTSLFWGLVKSDGSDIRIKNQSAQLYFWIEDFNYNERKATIWINVTPGSTEVDLAYGNPYATESIYEDGSKLFEFFDEFKDGTIDTSKWLGNVSNFYEYLGALHHNSYGTYHTIYSAKTFSGPFILESLVKEKPHGHTHGWVGIAVLSNDTSIEANLLINPEDNVYPNAVYFEGTYLSDNAQNNKWYLFRITKRDPNTYDGYISCHGYINTKIYGTELVRVGIRSKDYGSWKWIKLFRPRDPINFTSFQEKITSEEIPIPHWIEKKQNGSYAHVWIKVPLIPANNVDYGYGKGVAVIYMYYGNQTAKTKSNASATFLKIIGGIVGAYPLNEENISTIKDYSGNNNNGTTYNNVSSVPGIFDKALKFDGNRAYVKTKSSPTLNITGNITLVLWVNVSNFSSNYMYLIDKYINSQEKGYSLYLKTPGNICFTNGDGSHETTCTYGGYGNITEGKWYFIAAVHHPERNRIYLNGEMVREEHTTVGLVPSYQDLLFATSWPYHSMFNGTLDEIFIFNTSLNEEEIKEMYYNKVYVTLNLPHKILIRKKALIEPKYNISKTQTIVRFKFSDNYTVNISGELFSGKMIKYIATENESYRCEFIPENETYPKIYFKNISFSGNDSMLIETYDIDIPPEEFNLSKWSRAFRIQPTFSFNNYTVTFLNACNLIPLVCKNNCSEPKNWKMLNHTCKNNNLMLNLSTDPIITLGINASITLKSILPEDGETLNEGKIIFKAEVISNYPVNCTLFINKTATSTYSMNVSKLNSTTYVCTSEIELSPGMYVFYIEVNNSYNTVNNTPCSIYISPKPITSFTPASKSIPETNEACIITVMIASFLIFVHRKNTNQ